MTIAIHDQKKAQHTTEDFPLTERYSQPEGKASLEDFFYKETDLRFLFTEFFQAAYSKPQKMLI